MGSATLGVVGWSGNPLTLPLAMFFPALWSVAGSRVGAALVAAAYFLGASRGLPEGVSIFFGTDRLLGIALWVTASLVFVGTHAVCWTKRRGWRQPCRYLLANVLVSVPTLGILGWANPITAAGIMLPGWGWWGLAMTVVLLMASVTMRLRWPAMAVIGTLSISASMNWTDPAPPLGWRGIDTSFVTGREQYADYAQQIATIELVRAAAADGVKVVVLPESAFGIWTPTAEALWSGALANLEVTVIGGAVVLAGDGYENLMIAVTAEGANVLYRQRMPVPVSMWQPWSSGGAAADFFGNAVVELNEVRLAVLLCYEQLLVWPVLQSVAMRPDIMIATGNGWWTGTTSILPIQRAASVAWARLFNIPLAMAYNAPI